MEFVCYCSMGRQVYVPRQYTPQTGQYVETYILTRVFPPFQAHTVPEFFDIADDEAGQSIRLELPIGCDPTVPPSME